MLRPSNNKLTEVLEEANKLFKDGKWDYNHRNGAGLLCGRDMTEFYKFLRVNS